MTVTETPTGSIDTDMPDYEYHSLPSLSASGAKRILESPAKFRHAQLYPQAPKKAFDIGHAVHSRVLGIGAPIVEIPADMLATNGAVSTTRAKAFVADAREQGKVPLKPEEYQTIVGASDAVLLHPDAGAFFQQEGDAEVSVFGTDPDTGVAVRCRFDKLGVESGGVDLKTSAVTADPSAFGAIVARHGYDVQQEFYLDTYEAVTGERVGFVFVGVELTAPFGVAVMELDPDFVRMGREKAKRARALFAECAASGVWPGYPGGVNVISPPRWAVREFEEKYQ